MPSRDRVRERTRVASVLTHPATVAVAALVVLAVVLVVRGEWFVPRDDYAVQELAVHDAARLVRLLGPYSRFGFFHPGPMLFYAVAPAYELLAHNGGLAMVVTRLVVDAVCIAIIVVLVDRFGGRAAAWGASIGILVFELRTGLEWFRDPWNPYVVVLPLALALVAAAALHHGSTGRRARALLVVVAGSFAVQSHVGTAPLVALALVVGVVGFVRSARRPDGGPVRGDVLVVLGVAVVCWALPIWEQLTNSPGNLHDLAAFFTQSHQRPAIRPVVETVTGVVGLFSGHLGTVLGAEPFDAVPAPSWLAWTVVVGVLAVLTWAAVRWWRAQRHALAVLAAIVPLGYLVSLAAGLQIRGGLQPYLFAPVLAVSLVAWAALGALVSEPIAAAWPRALAPVAAIVAVIVLALVFAVGTRAFDPLHDSYGDALTATLRPAIVSLCAHGRPVHLVSDTAPWNRMSELGVALDDCGLDVTFSPRYGPTVGTHRTPDRAPDGSVELRLETPPVPRASGWHRLATTDAVSLDEAVDQLDAATRR